MMRAMTECAWPNYIIRDGRDAPAMNAKKKRRTQIPSRFRARPRRRLSKLFQIRARKAEKLFANMEMMLQFVCATPPMRVDERMRDPESHEFLMMMAETTTTTTKSLYICCATTYGSWRRRRCLGKQIKFADAPHPPHPAADVAEKASNVYSCVQCG